MDHAQIKLTNYYASY